MKSYRFLMASERGRLDFLQGPAPGSVFISIPYLSLESWMTLTKAITTHYKKGRVDLGRVPQVSRAS